MEHTLLIKKVIAGGKGLGTLSDGMVVMVSGALPGETVVVRETKTHRGFKEARLLRVVEPSPDRVVPPCPHYGLCGGCDLQHAAYPAQLAIKQQILREALERAHLDPAPDQPGPALPSPLPFGYRSRLRLHLDPTGRLGFHQNASNAVVQIRHCLLAVNPINRVIAAVVDGGWGDRLADHIAALELIHSPADDQVFLVLQPRPSLQIPLPANLVDQMHALADEVIVQTAKPGQDSKQALTTVLSQDFTLRGQPYRLNWDHRCFFQVNTQQNPRMIELALDLLPLAPRPFTALDLFCGMGNFSIPLGLAGAQVTGVEHNRQSIHWAEQNSRTNGIRARFIAEGVEPQLHTLVARKTRFDCILLDPPRQGLGKAAALLPLLEPERIISISCDPATLARDLALIGKGGYRISRITPVDMFPQTHHIESVALLERN
ncbi:class I SAM-dependent RNA methyltransferase [uncultured Desulfobulbus sp.]|uniref:class I SAM-dependent RNA methyltransferase n=1 Tax=uncultured Desulfobulbus sp. TaxID=239745 RepID=UPI0029C7AACF|nr:class I SAM-dependent RNA methyltransferase [uncultured Desulfobulbus sp.]